MVMLNFFLVIYLAHSASNHALRGQIDPFIFPSFTRSQELHQNPSLFDLPSLMVEVHPPIFWATHQPFSYLLIFSFYSRLSVFLIRLTYSIQLPTKPVYPQPEPNRLLLLAERQVRAS
jgi:hypothetical protein